MWRRETPPTCYLGVEGGKPARTPSSMSVWKSPSMAGRIQFGEIENNLYTELGDSLTGRA